MSVFFADVFFAQQGDVKYNYISVGFVLLVLQYRVMRRPQAVERAMIRSPRFFFV